MDEDEKQKYMDGLMFELEKLQKTVAHNATSAELTSGTSSHTHTISTNKMVLISPEAKKSIFKKISNTIKNIRCH